MSRDVRVRQGKGDPRESPIVALFGCLVLVTNTRVAMVSRFLAIALAVDALPSRPLTLIAERHRERMAPGRREGARQLGNATKPTVLHPQGGSADEGENEDGGDDG